MGYLLQQRPPATEVEEWLRGINLGRYAARFAERGIHALGQLQAMPSEAVREMGLKILEERRFLRARVAHLQADRAMLARNRGAHGQ